MLGQRRVRWIALATAAALGAAGLGACKGKSNLEAYKPAPSTTVPTPTVPTTTVVAPGVPEPTKFSLLALATGGAVSVHNAPGDATPAKVLGNPTFEGMQLAMLAIDRQDDWLQVRFPERPNGSLGWIRAAEVELTPLENRIVISLTNRNLRVLDKNQQPIYETDVAVGKPRTPTPVGRFYVDIWLPNPGSPYGKFMLSVAGFSDVLRNFGGGRGQIALHGWSDPSVMGRSVSNGCIRMRNEDILRLSQIAPLGTPVDVVA